MRNAPDNGTAIMEKEGNKCQFVNKWGIFSWNRFPILIIYQITHKWKICYLDVNIWFPNLFLIPAFLRNFVKLHQCTLILLLLTKPLINRIFLSPLHFWTNFEQKFRVINFFLTNCTTEIYSLSHILAKISWKQRF